MSDADPPDETSAVSRIVIIGCGNLGTALATRLASTCQVALYDHSPGKAEALAVRTGAIAYVTLVEALAGANLVLLAIKPRDLPAAASHLRELVGSRTLFASTLANTSLRELHGHLGDGIRLLRLMPSITCAFGDSAVGVCDAHVLTPLERQQVNALLAPLGSLYWIDEALMPACIALVGSMPAFVFVIVETMVDAAIAMGFPAPLAQQLAIQVCGSSLNTLKHSGQHPAALKWQVSSPSGTTIAGLTALEQHGLRNALIQTLLATYRRALE